MVIICSAATDVIFDRDTHPNRANHWVLPGIDLGGLLEKPDEWTGRFGNSMPTEDRGRAIQGGGGLSI